MALPAPFSSSAQVQEIAGTRELTPVHLRLKIFCRLGQTRGLSQGVKSAPISGIFAHFGGTKFKVV